MSAQKGFAQLLVVLLLLIGVGVAVWGVQYGRTVLKPKASEGNPNSTNSIISRINELEAKSEKIDRDYIQGEIDRMVKIPVVVFEDLNKNGIRDEGEVGIPNIPLESTSYYTETNSEDPQKIIYRKSLPWLARTDVNGSFMFKWDGPSTIVAGEQNINIKLQDVWVSVDKFDSTVGKHKPPFGWSKSDENRLLIKLYPSDLDYLSRPIQLNPVGETILETAEFPLIGAQKISGNLFQDLNKNGLKEKGEYPVTVKEGNKEAVGMMVLLDASKANNATKKTYISTIKDDGSYEFKDLPPLSEYRIKFSVACPFIATTTPYQGFTLGSAGIINYDVGFYYDENDPCVTN